MFSAITFRGRSMQSAIAISTDMHPQPVRPSQGPRAAFPLVSIVVDNFNYAGFVRQSIDSALAQTYPNVEVIVVDDASTDGSQQVIAEYGQRVTVVQHDLNRGQGSAFNDGFRASSGDIVMFLDADDWLYSDAVERVVAAWRPGQSKLHFRLHLVDRAGAVIDTYPAPELRLDRGDVVPLMLEFGRYETVVTSGNAFAREALKRTLPMPEEEFRIAADGYLATAVPFYGPIGCVDDCLGAYRVHGANGYAVSRRDSQVDDLLTRTRKILSHEARKMPVLLERAATAGLTIKGSPQLRDPSHLELRLASLRLDPRHHPNRHDGRFGLTMRGVAASRRARLPVARRAVLALWFLLVGLLPSRLAVPLLRWKMHPPSRPEWIDRQVKRARRFLTRTHPAERSIPPPPIPLR
jgi:hypothetical protein